MSASAAQLEKAFITKVIPKDQTRIEVMFNPKEYTFSKSNNWAFGQTKGKNMPKLEFSLGGPATMTMQLFFDTYGQGGAGGKPVDVRTRTDPLWDLMLVDKKRAEKTKHKFGQPPVIHFQWANAWNFDAVISQISLKFTMFDRTGVPVRATMDITFTQADDPGGFGRQNPTSGGRDGGRLWTVRDGDTLAAISYQEYGDATLWRRIADANGMTEVRRLRPGTYLEIPNG